jgi:hypothetical protein
VTLSVEQAHLALSWYSAFRIAFAPFGRDPLVLPTFSLGKTFGSAILSFEVVCRWRLKLGLIELVPCDFRLGSMLSKKYPR